MEKEKKNNGLIIITVMLALVLVALGGYVLYDKVLSNKEEEKTTTSNLDPNNDYETKAPIAIVNEIKREEDTIKLNEKEHKLTYVYSYEENDKAFFMDKMNSEVDSENDYFYKIYVTILFDGILVNDSKTLVDTHNDKDIATYKGNLLSSAQQSMKENVEVLKGQDDKQYLAVIIPEITLFESVDTTYQTANIAIINDKGNAIGYVSLKDQPNVYVSDEKLLAKYQDGQSIFENPLHMIDEGQLYYLDAYNIVGELKTPITEYLYGTVQEYRVDIKDDKITKVPLETYKATCMGGSC